MEGGRLESDGEWEFWKFTVFRKSTSLDKDGFDITEEYKNHDSQGEGSGMVVGNKIPWYHKSVVNISQGLTQRYRIRIC